MNNEQGEIFIYEAPDGQTTIEVSLERGTVWLSQQQIAELFGTQRPAITKHLNNIFTSNELEETSVCSILEHTAADGKRYKTKFYNLDAVLSVGYRVNSKSATLFRIWANAILKDYLVKGYAHNEKLLREKQAQLDSLKQAVALITNVTEANAVSGDQAAGLLRILTDYTYALDVLDKYDHQVLELEATSPRQLFQITYASAMDAIGSLRDKFGGSTLFGNEKDESFQGSLAAIYQTFGGVDLYPSVEEKAANLLYFVIKNHSFSDGNKRIAAFLFVWFLEKNAILYRADGSRKLADNALVALTLMIAESKPDEKDMMTRVVVSLVNGKN
jgi:prophage maintenance system killer protein